MKRPLIALAGAAWILMVMVVGLEVVRAADAALDTARIEQLTGGKGELNTQEGVFKVSVPRTDLTVMAAGVKMTPPMGLTSWAAFQQIGTQTIVMGDIVLLEDQVNPVMSVALTHGLEVTALHNHFFWDTPKVMFMHIGGMCSIETLAGAVGKVFATIKETSGEKGTVPHAELDPAKTSLDPKPIEEILGVKGQMVSGVYKVTIGRTTMMHGHEVGNTMGVNTWAAFVGSDDTAVVDGDFAMLESELAAGAESVAWRGHQYRGDSSAYDHGVSQGDVSALLGCGPDTGTGHRVESRPRHAASLTDTARGGTDRRNRNYMRWGRR